MNHFFPSSSWKSEGSKPEEFTCTGSDLWGDGSSQQNVSDFTSDCILGLVPWAFNLWRGYNVVVSILEGSILTSNIRVDEPELLPIVCETRCPDSAAVGLASHVKLCLSVEWADDKIPVCQIFRVVDLNSWIPFESGCGNIVVLANPQNGRVGVEAWENRVSDLRHGDEEWWKLEVD